MTKNNARVGGKKRPQPYQLFQRTLERDKKNHRSGLVKAIDSAHFSDLPSIVRTLFKSPVYANLIAPQPFPAAMVNRPSLIRLDISDSGKALLWNACVASMFSSRLAEFVRKKQEFEHELLFGTIDDAFKTLEEIEQDFGQSLWLIKNKINALQIKSGTSGQKAYISSLLDDEGSNVWLGAIAYYKSALCEPNVSMETIRDELSGALVQSHLHDYLVYHLFPYYIADIDSGSLVLSYDEMQPLIDRYEAVLSMAALSVANGGALIEHSTYYALSQLTSVNDDRVSGLISVIEGRDPEVLGSGLDDAFTSYMLGDYSRINEPSLHLLELEASICAIDAEYLSRCKRPLHTQLIINSMREFILLSEKTGSAASYLRKMISSYAPHPVSIVLSAFLERKHDYIQVEKFSTLDNLSALIDFSKNPWSLLAVCELIGSPGLFERVANSSLLPSSVRLLNAIRSDYDMGLAEIRRMELPQPRQDAYMGHLALRCGRNELAIESYRKAISLGNAYVSKRVSVHLFSALFATGRNEEALCLVLDQCLHVPGALPLFPVEDLLEVISGDRIISKRMEYSILVHLCSVNSLDRGGVNVSDAFENFLLAERIDRPSEIPSKLPNLNLARLVYFFKHVCSLKILEELTVLDGIDGAEAERIKICQMLCKIDPLHANTYASEIKEITRNANSAKLLRIVHASKIYVDEEGLLSSIEPTLRELYERFVECRQRPESDTGSFEISQKLGHIFKRDMAAEEQAGSELETLFANILNFFAIQFATHAAYGLNTHISTSIRHHPFEGHFRSAFDKEGLLCFRSKVKPEFKTPPKWDGVLSQVSPVSRQQLERALTKFTECVVGEINRYLTELLHIRHVETHPNGMINLLVGRQERLALLSSMRHVDSYEQFVRKFVDYCWDMVDVSLGLIRNELRENTVVLINKELGRLESAINRVPELDKVADMQDAIVRARTAFQGSFDEISNWFHRPKDLARVPFDMDSAIDVAIAQVKNCWSAISINVSQSSSIDYKINGACLDGLVEILFIFIQNIIIHSGQPRDDIRGSVNVEPYNDGVLIVVENQVSDLEDIEVLRDQARLATNRQGVDREKNMKRAGTEGKSGLSKVWLILEFDLRRPYHMNLEVSDNRVFKSTLAIEGLRA